MKLTLTDIEWVQLIDGRSDDSQLEVCCANVSDLRDRFLNIIRSGRNNDLMESQIDRLKTTLGVVASSHELSPLLQKVCRQLDLDPDKIAEEWRGES